MSDLFPGAVYLLCFLTSSLCAFLLARNYWRSGARLLLWSALCFVFLAANSLVVILDLLVIPTWDFRLVRHSLSLMAVVVLLFGFVWESEQ
jgi:hypothetical protein